MYTCILLVLGNYVNFYFISEFFILQIFKNPVDFSYSFCREYKMKIILKFDEIFKNKLDISI